MSSFEEQYYEYDAFWNPAINPFGDGEHARVAEVYKLIPAGVRSMLDAGCGNGIFCNFVKQQGNGVKIVGLDRSNVALSYVQTEKIRASLDDLPFPEQSFDCVVSLEVVEHLPINIYELAKREIARVARKYIVISVPNNQMLGTHQTQCPACKTRFDPDLHLRSFNQENLRDLFQAEGFDCVTVRKLGYYSNYRGMRAYLDWKNKSSPQAMLSPICPVCGYANKAYKVGTQVLSHNLKQTSNPLTRAVKNILKTYWPREHNAHWLVAVYERKGRGEEIRDNYR
jgi:SAM-dependent methyltransferase